MAKQPEDVAGLVYFGLYSLQHRGQESCGIVVNDDGVFVSISCAMYIALHRGFRVNSIELYSLKLI